MAFRPEEHLIDLSGGRGTPRMYLETKWRIVWLHDKHPDASIQTEIVRTTDDSVVVRAEVSIPHGDRVATFSAYKSAPMTGRFPAIEKAETGAIGRALAHAGFGTQHAGEDVDEDVAGGGIADSPVQRASRPAPPRGEDIEDVPFDGPSIDFTTPPQSSNLASDKQIKLMGVLMDKAAISIEDARAVLKERYGKTSRTVLTKSEATDFIDWLQTQQPMEQPVLAGS